jgi:hypothetical protein
MWASSWVIAAHARIPLSSPTAPSGRRCKLREAVRQLAVTVWPRLEDLDVHRAVLRLEQVAVDIARPRAVGEFRAGATLVRQPFELFVLDDGRELALAVIREVAAGAVETEAPVVGVKTCW